MIYNDNDGSYIKFKEYAHIVKRFDIKNLLVLILSNYLYKIV
jgi:hypothetical protein